MEPAAEAKRQAELLETQRLLRAVGASERATPRNLAYDALRRLRVRQKAIGNVNEIFAALSAVVRGFGVLFSSGDQRHDDRG